MFGSERSAHDWPPLVLTNTPELAVKFCGEPARRPLNVTTSVPSFNTTMLKAWPCVRGGLVTRVHVEAEPACRLLVTQMPPSTLWATDAYRRFGLVGST